MRSRWLRRVSAGAAMMVFCALSGGICARAQNSADPSGSDAGDSEAGGARVLLVLPFDNRTGQPNLEWMREAAAQVLSTRFASAGFEPTSRADRLYALD